MKFRISFFIIMLTVLIASGCAPVAKTQVENNQTDKLVPSPKELDLPNQPPAPDKYRVKLETSEGDIIIEVTRDWSPHGADRFYTLVKNHFYDDCRFFRVIPGFMAQCGLNGDPRVNMEWRGTNIPDDPVKESNLRGYVTFATSGPNSRTTQFFINFKDNSFLDKDGFSPFGKVVEGMNVVDALYSGYGEQPNQGQIAQVGNSYLRDHFPQLDFIKKATIISEGDKQPAVKTETKTNTPPGKTEPSQKTKAKK
ncbi:MAG: hypothetical protein Tsb009_26950 [Planctomycetaceae bacterium]